MAKEHFKSKYYARTSNQIFHSKILTYITVDMAIFLTIYHGTFFITIFTIRFNVHFGRIYNPRNLDKNIFFYAEFDY